MKHRKRQWGIYGRQPVWRSLLPEALWRQALLLSTPQLQEEITTEVCVVGAGITGLSVAYNLMHAGKRVVILDSIGGAGFSGKEHYHFSESLRTAAHLTQVMDAGYGAIIGTHGVKGAQQVAESHGRAIDWIEATIAREHLECDFARVDGYLFLPPGEPRARLERELHSAHMAGIRGVEWVDDLPLQGVDAGPGVVYPRQARMSPVPYLIGLRTAIEEGGGALYAATRVTGIGERQGKRRVETAQGVSVLAEDVVIASHVPFNDRFAIHSKQLARRTYVLAGAVPRGSVPDALFWEFAAPKPGHYIRVLRGRDGRDLVVVGGEDHRVGFGASEREGFSRLRRLEWWARERFPMMQEVVAAWSGQTLVTPDGLAYIGRKPYDHPQVYIATGDNGIGLTHGTIAGWLLTDLILHRESPWAALYDPGRFDKVSFDAGLVHRLRDIAEVALCYGDYLHTPDGEGVERELEAVEIKALQPGQGCRLNANGKKLACYRDEVGTVHCFSAVCPHMKGLVRWNALEKTWDCPCHGSRFAAEDGHVVNGPATEGLKPAETPLPGVPHEEKQGAVKQGFKRIAGKLVKGIQRTASARHRE